MTTATWKCDHLSSVEIWAELKIYIDADVWVYIQDGLRYYMNWKSLDDSKFNNTLVNSKLHKYNVKWDNITFS